jgi:signal peptidase
MLVRGGTIAAGRPRARWRSALAGARLAVLFAFLVVWALLLRPQALGGPAEWVLVSGNSMQPGLQDGDLVLAMRRSQYRRGDVIAYRIPRGDVGAGSVVIHRITGGGGPEGFVTRGDNRARRDLWRPTDRDIAGRLVATVPAAGDVLRLLRSPIVLAALAALTAFVSMPARAGGTVRCRL